MLKSNSKVSLTCLAYLSCLADQSLTFPIQEIKTKYPLARYSAQYWMDHARSSETEEAVQESIMSSFLRQKEAYAVWYKRFDPDQPWQETSQRQEKDRATPLYYAFIAGIKHTVELLLKVGADVNTQGGMFGSALQTACYQGYREIA